MPPSAAVIARDQRTGPRTALAGYRAGASLPDLATAEEVDPSIVRRVQRAAGRGPPCFPFVTLHGFSTRDSGL
jgi:hypothetical protein